MLCFCTYFGSYDFECCHQLEKIYLKHECNKCWHIYFVIIAGPGRYNEFGVEDQAGTVHRLQWTNLR